MPELNQFHPVYPPDRFGIAGMSFSTRLYGACRSCSRGPAVPGLMRAATSLLDCVCLRWLHLKLLRGPASIAFCVSPCAVTPWHIGKLMMTVPLVLPFLSFLLALCLCAAS